MKFRASRTVLFGAASEAISLTQLKGMSWAHELWQNYTPAFPWVSRTTLQMKKITDQIFSLIGQNTFRVELHTFHK